MKFGKLGANMLLANKRPKTRNLFVENLAQMKSVIFSVKKMHSKVSQYDQVI